MSRSKYGAKKVTVDGITFDSKKEANRWCELWLMERAGVITGLERQVKFVLIPSQCEKVERYSKTGKRLSDDFRCVEREVSYVADFVYYQDGKMVVEDTKGFKTDAYIIKRKLMRYVHGIAIKEI